MPDSHRESVRLGAPPVAGDSVILTGAGTMTREYYLRVRGEELARLQPEANAVSRITDAAALLDALVPGEFEEFLTVVGYQVLA